MDEKARVAGIQRVRKWWNIYLLCTLGHTLFMSSLARLCVSVSFYLTAGGQVPKARVLTFPCGTKAAGE